MTTIAENFKISDFIEHLKNKGLWAGAVTPISINNLYGLTDSNTLVEITNHHTPAILKAIDEIIVNAIDHCKECESNPKPSRVTNISVTFEIDTGSISVFNNGPGIPIVRYKDSDYYLIECAFSKPLAGSNIDKPTDSIKGGTNGLGAKIANVHSVLFTVETVNNKQKYKQTFKNRLSIIESPIITSTNEKDYTRVSFTPAYLEMGYIMSTLKIYLTDILHWLKFRLHQAAAYVGGKIEITLNNTIINTKSSEDLAKLLSNDTDKIISTLVKNTVNQHTLQITAIIPTEKKKTTIQNLTVINGVVSTKGSHIRYVRDIIKTFLNTKITKTTKGSTNVNYKDINTIQLIICGPIPGIDWSGQNKDTVEVSVKYLKNYKLSDVFLKQIQKEMIEELLKSKTPVSKEKIEHDKYIPAHNISNKKLKHKCLLLAAEGDSAISLLRTGLTQKNNKTEEMKQGKLCDFLPTFKWCGIISLQGVIINAAKETSTLDHDNGNISTIRSNKLTNNKRLNMLADAFGLNYNYKYETKEEINTLNYGKLIICTDQDLDGTGKIASLVLVWIHTFWPSLLKNNIVGKLMTPLIRVVNNHDKLEFYYEQELYEWLKTAGTNKCNIKYYKGLATHDAHEAETMFIYTNFNKNIFTYTYDELTDELFKVYFGNDPSLRKKILITPVKHLSLTESKSLKSLQEIPLGKVQLNIDTKLYKNDAINRQLPHIIDGLNPARRKILMGSIMRFNSDSKEIKVFQLGGYIADKMRYHHGDASLNKTIVTMAQSFTNARIYPYLIGIGQFGSRHGDDAGSARYISVKLSTIVNAIFPIEDRWLLKYTYDEGIRTEPEYFVPVLPMAILESYHIVTEGWNHMSIGRNIKNVIEIVKKYLQGNTELHRVTERVYNSKEITTYDKYKLNVHSGDIRMYKNSEYSFGNYEYEENDTKMIITELPINVNTKTYITNLTKNPYVEKIVDNSPTDEIEIYVYFNNSFDINVIKEKYGNDVVDPIEDCFNLRSSLKPNLNYYSCEGGILEFNDSYMTALLYWLPVRRQLYKERLIRKEIITRIMIKKEKSIIRYISLSNTLNISKIDDETEAIQILKQNKFPGIDSSLLHSPQYTSNDDLERLINMENQYDYILDLKERELTKQSVEKRNERVKKLEEEYSLIVSYLEERPFPGVTIWMNEIDNIIRILNIK